MRQILWFFRWKRRWWIDQAAQRVDTQPDIGEGLKAYAAKQAGMLDRMAEGFTDEWFQILAAHGMEMAWPEEYLRGRRSWEMKDNVRKEVEDDDEVELDNDMCE
jgi:hypothetical protein